MIRDLPYGISDLTQLVQLALPNMHNIQGSESKRKECSMEIPNENQWAISSLSGEVSHSKRSLVSLSGAEFVELLKRNHPFKDTSFKNFHLFVHPIQLQSGIGGFYVHKDEYIFRDIYFQSWHCPSLEEQSNLLEIHGFHSFPKGIENILGHAKHIFLQDNLFFRSLADLGAENLRMMRGCWIDRCQNMESLMHEDTAGDFVELGKKLEMLWISSAFSLKNVDSSKLQADCFQNLKYLHLDCCPGLSVVFLESHFLQNLEVLDVKFCDKLESLFENNSKKHMLPKLHKLHLWELLELKTIRRLLPSLQVLDVGRCPMLEHVLPSGCLPENLTVVKVQHCDTLCTLAEETAQQKYNLPSLNTIELRGLPELTNIDFDLPLHFCIKECPKLQLPVQ